MSNLVDFARRELEILSRSRTDDDDPEVAKIENAMQREMEKNILELVGVFAAQGHSGGSSSWALNILTKVLKYHPLSPLTGGDDEWTEVGPDVFQNTRSGRVFKEKGVAYDIDGIVFCEPSGSCFTNRDSRVEVTFPYTPKTEYRDVPETPNEN